MGAAYSCQRDGYYAILHAARAALQLHGVTTESHTGVRSMFGLHIVKTGLVEPEWGAEIGRSEGRRIASDYAPKRSSTKPTPAKPASAPMPS